jgi:fatty acid desaturase
MHDPLLPARLAQERKPLSSVVRVLLNWALIVAAWMFVARVPHPAVYVLVFLVVGVQQHALGLWMHESAHWLLTKNKRVNDLVSVLFLSGPLFVPLRAYRARHFAHHGFLGTAQDTKQVIFTPIQGAKRFWSFAFLTVTGLQLFSIARGYFSPDEKINERVSLVTWVGDGLAILAVQAVIFTVVASMAPWTFYIWFWLLPWFTINRLLAALRALIEHQPFAGVAHPHTRTLRPTWLERFVFCRAGFDWHWTHHRYPTIPCFNLQHVPIDAEQPVAHRTGYLAVLVALVRQK